MKDLFQKIAADQTVKRAKTAAQADLYPYFRAISRSQDTVAQFEGREVVMLGSNNYLGLTLDPRVQAAAIEATQRYGTSVTGSRFLNGTLDLHLEVEARLADFVGKEAALTFPTGYQTVLGTISALVGRDDVVILDREAHACAVDGSALSRGAIRRFRHNEPDHLDDILSGLPPEVGKLVVVDGIYSMSGDMAPLEALADVCTHHGARILVDDAHGLGVMGTGRGTCFELGVTDKIDLIMGTFSKSFASVGGVIAGDADVIRFIQHHARPFIFSAALPPTNLAAVSTVLDIIYAEPERIDRLHYNASSLRNALHDLGFSVGASQAAIIPTYVQGDDLEIVALWQALIDRGVYVNPVVPPATPNGTGILRASVTANHEPHHLERVRAAFEAVR